MDNNDVFTATFLEITISNYNHTEIPPQSQRRKMEKMPLSMLFPSDLEHNGINTNQVDYTSTTDNLS